MNQLQTITLRVGSTDFETTLQTLARAPETSPLRTTPTTDAKQHHTLFLDRVCALLLYFVRFTFFTWFVLHCVLYRMAHIFAMFWISCVMGSCPCLVIWSFAKSCWEKVWKHKNSFFAVCGCFCHTHERDTHRENTERHAHTRLHIERGTQHAP